MGNKTMTITEIKKQFPDEFISVAIIVDGETDDEMEGFVIAHGPSQSVVIEEERVYRDSHPSINHIYFISNIPMPAEGVLL